MTDEQIVKALECCIQVDWDVCTVCPLYDREEGCLSGDLRREALDIIKRQQAEIEELKKVGNKIESLGLVATLIDQRERLARAKNEWERKVRAEAIKEFAEKILNLFPSDKNHTIISRFTVKQIAKEMTEEEK